jgi:hypothetical protein
MKKCQEVDENVYWYYMWLICGERLQRTCVLFLKNSKYDTTTKNTKKYRKKSENLVNPHSGHYITNITLTRLHEATSLLCATARVAAEFSSLRIQPLALTVRSVSTSYGFWRPIYLCIIILVRPPCLKQDVPQVNSRLASFSSLFPPSTAFHHDLIHIYVLARWWFLTSLRHKKALFLFLGFLLFLCKNRCRGEKRDRTKAHKKSSSIE